MTPEGRLAPRLGGWEHSGLPGPPRGWGSGSSMEGRRREGGEERRREWEAEVSQQLGTRVGEKHSQQFPREKAASPPRAPSWSAEPAGPPAHRHPRAAPRSRSPEGSLQRPGLPAFLPLTILAPVCCRSLRHPESAEPSGAASNGQAATPDVHSWARAAPDLRVNGSRQAIFTCRRRSWQSRQPGSSRRPGEGSVGGRGLALPRLSPGRPCRQR